MKKIVFDNVSKAFGNLQILDKVSFEIDDREAMIILGRSGMGKSVTLKLLLGLLSVDEGDIIVNGISVRDAARRDEYRSMFSVLFQGCALFDSMTVLENITFPLINHGVLEKQAVDIALQKINDVGLDESILGFYPSALSGGMQKRVALARAIAVEPEIMLFDEPTSGLDPVTSRKISLLIKSLLSTVKVTSLTITHDLNVAKCFGSRAAMLDNAKIVWDGKINAMDQSDSPVVQEFIKVYRDIDDE